MSCATDNLDWVGLLLVALVIKGFAGIDSSKKSELIPALSKTLSRLPTLMFVCMPTWNLSNPDIKEVLPIVV